MPERAAHPPAAAPRHVFVYGTLRAGGSNDIARWQPAPQFVGAADIAGTLYDLGAYPGARLGGTARLHGEVYRIEPELESQLDRLEGVQPDGQGEYLKREVRVRVGGRALACLVYEIHPQRLPGRFLLHPYGVADFDGSARFAAPRKRKFASFSLVRREGVGPAVEAPVHRVATLIGMLHLPPPDVIKMDIEGAEYAVLSDVLASDLRPAQILVEFHHRWREVGARRTRAALKLLAACGYRIADVAENGLEYVFLREKANTEG